MLDSMQKRFWLNAARERDEDSESEHVSSACPHPLVGKIGFQLSLNIL